MQRADPVGPFNPFLASPGLPAKTIRPRLTRRAVGAADQRDSLGAVHELAAMEGPNGDFVDLAGGAAEAREVLVGRDACSLHVAGDGAHLAFGQFGLQQWQPDRDGGFTRRGPLFDEILNGSGQAAALPFEMPDMPIALTRSSTERVELP